MLLHDAAGSVVVVSAESVKMAGEGCIVLRCLKGLVCAITSLSLRRKEPNRPSMNQGAVK